MKVCDYILMMLCAACLFFVASCDKSDTVFNDPYVLTENLGECVVEGSITPFSVTIDTRGNNRYAIISENKDSLEIVNNNYDYYSVYLPMDVKKEDSSSGGSYYVTFDELKPSTTYYYFVAYDYWGTSEKTPIHSFKTEDINLKCNLGGSVNWCGVNYLENRGEFESSQFLKGSLFSYKELPDPASETIEGNWRYPTIDELQELCDNCKVTMVDFKNEFVRITSTNGSNMYIPYTLYTPHEKNSNGLKQLMLFPSDEKEYGLGVWTNDMMPLSDYWRDEFGHYVKFEEETKSYDLYIKKPVNRNTDREENFFKWWVYYYDSNSIKQIGNGDSKRGVRFVED